MVINMNKKMYFKIDKIPDLSLNKYSSLSETGIDGILERHTSFLRQWSSITTIFPSAGATTSFEVSSTLRYLTGQR